LPRAYNAGETSMTVEYPISTGAYHMSAAAQAAVSATVKRQP
jgi:hypothetical protein